MIKIDTKICSECGIDKPFSEFYSQKKNSKKRGEYIYYKPECKLCTAKRSLEWRKNNYDAWLQHEYKYRETPKGQITKKKASNKFRKTEKYRKWHDENKDRLRTYRIKRSEHKSHEINKNEWINCKSYFNNKCAYCGLQEDEHYIRWRNEIKKSDLHKEHVSHNGANDLSNCIPSCRDCNSEKWEFEFEEWYNESNPKYSKDRYGKIHKWLNEDYLKYIEKK